MGDLDIDFETRGIEVRTDIYWRRRLFELSFQSSGDKITPASSRAPSAYGEYLLQSRSILGRILPDAHLLLTLNQHISPSSSTFPLFDVISRHWNYHPNSPQKRCTRPRDREPHATQLISHPPT